MALWIFITNPGLCGNGTIQMHLLSRSDSGHYWKLEASDVPLKCLFVYILIHTCNGGYFPWARYMDELLINCLKNTSLLAALNTQTSWRSTVLVLPSDFPSASDPPDRYHGFIFVSTFQWGIGDNGRLCGKHACPCPVGFDGLTNESFPLMTMPLPICTCTVSAIKSRDPWSKVLSSYIFHAFKTCIERTGRRFQIWTNTTPCRAEIERASLKMLPWWIVHPEKWKK